MDYQLVLQFRGDSLADVDALVALEDELINAFGTSADVDGHDMGSGEANIFIISSDPRKTFGDAEKVLQKLGKLKDVVAAFRELEGENYTVIWPEGFSGQFSVA